MTIFYRGPTVEITHDTFEVRDPSHQVFHVKELGEMYVVRHQLGHVVVMFVLTMAAAAGAFVAAFIHLFAGAMGAVITGAAITVVAIVWAWARDTRSQSRVNELSALYRGRRVVLYRSTDPRAFGQVCRALARAMEQAAMD